MDIEELGLQADSLDNLVAGFNLPFPAEFHVEQLKKILPEISQKIKDYYEATTGENPWE